MRRAIVHSSEQLGIDPEFNTRICAIRIAEQLSSSRGVACETLTATSVHYIVNRAGCQTNDNDRNK